MSLIPSLLQAIVGVDGEALVMHAGEKPYVIAPAGQVDLASRGLTFDAVKGIVAQLLPADALQALEEFGAIQHEIVAPPEFPAETFTVVAARGGDDMWVEIRRKKISVDDRVPEESFAPLPAGVGLKSQAGIEVPLTSQELMTSTMKQLWEASPVNIAAPMLPPLASMPVAPGAPETTVATSIAPAPITTQSDSGHRATSPPPAVVLPISRGPVRADAPSSSSPSSTSGLERLLRVAAARGASTLYLSSNARPSVRQHGEVQVLDGEPALGPNDVESLLLTLIPDRNHETLQSGLATEWISDLEGVGRVRCMSFRDHRGPGGVFRLMPSRAAGQLGLSRELEALAAEPEGLVLVTGPRLSGKRTMMAALVDVINQTRRDYVITIENEVNAAHERGMSFISQREVRSGSDDIERVARAALREDPDVLVMESMRTAALVDVALEAAASGVLVIGGLPAHDTASAVHRIISLYPPDGRLQVQLRLAENLRGIAAQVLLRKSGGGRIAARELLLNTPAVASVIAGGRISQLPMAIDGGRRQGMQALNDSLAALVQSGAVELREAYRRSVDRQGFLALLKRLGFDTAPLGRLG